MNRTVRVKHALQQIALCHCVNLRVTWQAGLDVRVKGREWAKKEIRLEKLLFCEQETSYFQVIGLA